MQPWDEEENFSSGSSVVNELILPITFKEEVAFEFFSPFTRLDAALYPFSDPMNDNIAGSNVDQRCNLTCIYRNDSYSNKR